MDLGKSLLPLKNNVELSRLFISQDNNAYFLAVNKGIWCSLLL